MLFEEVEEKEKHITVEEDDDQTDSLVTHSPLDAWLSDDKPLKTHKVVVEEMVGKVAVALPPEEQKEGSRALCPASA